MSTKFIAPRRQAPKDFLFACSLSNILFRRGKVHEFSSAIVTSWRRWRSLSEYNKRAKETLDHTVGQTCLSSLVLNRRRYFVAYPQRVTVLSQ
jgi:hypothetical protein